ncbi:hypothetical protein [Alistipes sp.]|uniref:hypothetical protein n=1 Tax=Alistipes sp. TaxID=1872444 RepID=UPI003991802A
MNELTGSKGCLATDTRSLREIAPLLENYFGITLGYFTNEIESSTGISAAKAIQEEHEIRLPTNRFDYDAYMEQFGETPPVDRPTAGSPLVHGLHHHRPQIQRGGVI